MFPALAGPENPLGHPWDPGARAAPGWWWQRELQGQVCPVPSFGVLVPMGIWQLGWLPLKELSWAGRVPWDLPWEGAVALGWGGVTFLQGHGIQLMWE